MISVNGMQPCKLHTSSIPAAHPAKSEPHKPAQLGHNFGQSLSPHRNPGLNRVVITGCLEDWPELCDVLSF